MSSETATFQHPATNPGWELWRKQLAGVLRLELRKNVFSMRAVLLYLLAAIPVGLLGLLALVSFFKGREAQINASAAFSGFFVFFLGLLFFACLIVFLQLFRGDLMDQSLHYYFLSPVRRSVLVTAKFLAGVASTTVVLSISLVLCYALIHYIFVGTGVTEPGIFTNLIRYLLVSFLAVLGYGSIFMLSGLYFRNPVVPPFALFLWEAAHPFLPAVLKKFSVTYYIRVLMPFPIEAQAFEILAEPISPVFAVLGLLGLVGLAIWLSVRRIRQMEISYTDD